MTAPPPATKAHPALVAAAVLLVLTVCGPIGVQLMSEVVSSTVERTSSFTPATARFVVDADVGEVTLGPSPDGRVHVRTVVRHSLGEPELVEESTPAGLRVDAACSEALGGRCDVDYRVEVPPAFEVVVRGTDGDVAATGLTGPLTVDRLDGDVTVLDHTGPLDLHTSTGTITGDDLRSEVVRADSDTGDVRLELHAPPRSVDVDTAAGRVDLGVPADTGYRIEIVTADGQLDLLPGRDEQGWVSDGGIDWGEVRVAVPHDPASPRLLRVATDGGEMTIRPFS